MSDLLKETNNDIPESVKNAMRTIQDFCTNRTCILNKKQCPLFKKCDFCFNVKPEHWEI